ncbi:hypothetical protein [Pseudalkalibacillus salsuginis]|uniref:hypothetical protein n=1 Tax=Pseudalkalibacillus salsuginis TaxID=2910972 RepID=UPI001F344309|nr:hypothetical protein [Pseudalkalibacillus salsuginis]MCF6409119.1 hypothetical protein [Pseudalkalibacillus salsuginis]
MKRKLTVLVVGLFLLTACNSENFTFSGETENWAASLNVNQNNDYEDQEFVLHYKGENVDSVGEIAYDVKTNAGSFGGSGLTLEENGSLKDSSKGNPTTAKISKDSKVEVIVEWNDNAETITLNTD